MAMRWSVCVCGVLAVVLRQPVAAQSVDVGINDPKLDLDYTPWGMDCKRRGMNYQDVVRNTGSEGPAVGVEPLTFGGPMYVVAGINIQSFVEFATIFDFGGDFQTDRVLLTFGGVPVGGSSFLTLIVVRHGAWKYLQCTVPLRLNRGYRVEVIIAEDYNEPGVVGRIVLHGQLCAEGPLHLPEVVHRSPNLIGGSGLVGKVQIYAITACRMEPICDNALDVVNDQSMDSNKDHPLTLAPSTFGGPIYVKARVTLNSHTQWGRIIDFGNGAGPDNIIVTLWDSSKQIAVQVHRDGAGEAGVVQCPVVVPLGASFTVEANILRVGSSDTQGEATIYIDGVWCAKGAVHLPRVVHRSKNYVGHSNWAGNEPLDGTVSSLVVSSCPLPCVDVKPVASFEDPETFNQQAPLTFGGGFYFKATVTFNEHTEWGRIFDFGNGAEMDNVLLGLFADTKQLVLEVWRGDVRQNVVCTTVVPLHTAVTVEASITPISGSTVDGVGSIYINGVRCVEGPVHQPREVLRVSNLVKKSNWPGNSDLEGSVNNFQLSTC